MQMLSVVFAAAFSFPLPEKNGKILICQSQFMVCMPVYFLYACLVICLLGLFVVFLSLFACLGKQKCRCGPID